MNKTYRLFWWKNGKEIVKSQDGVKKDNLVQISEAANKQNLAPPVRFQSLPIYLDSIGNEKDQATCMLALRGWRLHRFSGNNLV